ncbi:uncharacterized protein EAE97_001975 [Botrytis byssoidea]|uniref:Uncharacterized protein n=1 Tax=Botrytis byssoidea TaxID=139641 RepID=A0A9P5ISW0_9HELO|nr:uncharacterized protein EAE97_001975 [Botrytis byssoidea]KAF7952478.1 hypothetical protein EAE97_001975 [Botrytis byssoidea]
MPSTETLEVVRHQTTIWAVTTRIAVVDAVVSAPIALPSSTEYCSITHRIDNNVCTGDIVGLMILLGGFFIRLIMNMAICFEESEKDVKDLIGWLKYRPKEEWEDIIDSRAEALGNWTECRPYKVHHSKKKKRSLLSIFRGASNAIKQDNDVKDYIRGVRGFSKSIKVDDDGKISQDTIDDLF